MIMPAKMKDWETIKKYLLGNLPPEEQEDLELWLMSDDQAYDLLEAVEDDLIDASLRGELKGSDLDQFNSHFLIAPERKRKLQFSRSLIRFIDRPPVPERTSFWAALRALFQFRALVYAVPVLLFVVLVGSFWLARKQNQLQRQLDSTLNQLAETNRQRDELQKQLQETQATIGEQQKQLRAVDTATQPKSVGASPALIAVNLIPNLTRTANNIPAVGLPADTQFVQFSLALLDDNYPAYRVALRDANGRELWSKDGLTSKSSPDGMAIVFLVPGSLLAPADYTLTLSGISTSKTPETINTFLFRTVRRP
jgi:hypothetical protein